MRGSLAAITPTQRFYLGLATLGVALSVAGVLVPVAEVWSADRGPVIQIDFDKAEIESVGGNWLFTSAEVRWHYTDPVIQVTHPSYVSGDWRMGTWVVWSAFLMTPALGVMVALPQRRLAALPMVVAAISLVMALLALRGVGTEWVVLSGGPEIVWKDTSALVPVGAFLAGAGGLLWLTEPREWRDEQLRTAPSGVSGQR
ncbi:MAG: hypothetical protein F4Z08_00060 [Chloroflexi bacterium]|nr:hypothetical protein [Chloroflexota bacterium]MXZ63855.1 hypothetical protein [Chloroflexota bacterium]